MADDVRKKKRWLRDLALVAITAPISFAMWWFLLTVVFPRG